MKEVYLKFQLERPIEISGMCFMGKPGQTMNKSKAEVSIWAKPFGEVYKGS